MPPIRLLHQLAKPLLQLVVAGTLVTAGVATASAPSVQPTPSTATVGIVVEGQAYTSMAALRQSVVSNGKTLERFLRANPRVAAAFELRAVPWGGKYFTRRLPSHSG